MDTEKQIQALQEQISKQAAQIAELSSNFYKNNFASTQIFNKDMVFSTSLRVPVYSVTPTVAEVGQLIAISGVLYICTDNSPVTWTVVGTQT